ncbi:hypothetical protein AVEN_125763-1 [Araneus ventricosus]|uniref:Uncharacterized protein n=1 Tax=Araneus ventricosus TaxID=182803 RepID=A0A4Y2ICV0_ARAVE|nr:hypothetical protein AVEN_125763-1 [Araneus ventricosus]
MTRMTPELTSPSPNFRAHGGSSVESGLGLGTGGSQVRDPTTRPSRPHELSEINIRGKNINSILRIIICETNSGAMCLRGQYGDTPRSGQIN